MAFDTLITPLNFNDSLIGKSWNDKKVGLEISIGYISGLPADLAEITYASGDVGISLMDRGMGQKELDIACQTLSESASREAFTLLITKSDFPFDTRWYLLGDINAALEAAQRDRFSLPFSNFLYDEVLDSLGKYKR